MCTTLPCRFVLYPRSSRPLRVLAAAVRVNKYEAELRPPYVYPAVYFPGITSGMEVSLEHSVVGQLRSFKRAEIRARRWDRERAGFKIVTSGDFIPDV